jgi:Uma2 family endonuclease
MRTQPLTAQAPPRQARVTLEEFKRLRHDGYKAELVNGEVKMSPAGLRHERIGVKLIMLLERFLETQPLGHVYGSSAGYTLLNGDVRSPDVSFVTLTRLPGGRDPDDYAEFPPDLAVEILSPHDRVRDLNDRLAEYFDFGVRLVWVLDPKRQTVTVYRSWADAHTLRADELLDGGDVLPGFAGRVGEIFD